MTANPERWSVDFAEYLRFQRESKQRHELIGGEIIALGRASIRHSVRCGRLEEALHLA